ncbi:MAG: hypothetical protein Kow00122_01240 [Thermoleophilia bacterium]|nr:hypothetical protein [Actinomycetota bacterium]
MAVVYFVASLRSQLWLSLRRGGSFALLSVGAFLLRLTLFGAFLFAVDRLTALDVVVVAVAFVAVFTVLSGYSLFRLATRGRLPGVSSHVAP